MYLAVGQSFNLIFTILMPEKTKCFLNKPKYNISSEKNQRANHIIGWLFSEKGA